MTIPQSGIFALGTAPHACLELYARDRAVAPDLVNALASLREPRTTMGGVNFVVGFRPELWRELVPELKRKPPSLKVGTPGYENRLAASNLRRGPATWLAAALDNLLTNRSDVQIAGQLVVEEFNDSDRRRR